MTWFEDLSPYSYLGRVASGAPTLNVGWLERGRPFPTATPSPALSDRLAELVEHAQTNATRGKHFCDLCLGDASGVQPWGYAEIRAVGDDGTRYAAPSLIHHYVAAHSYAPPKAFLDAITRVRMSSTLAMQQLLCLACGSRLERVNFYEAMQVDEAGGRRQVRVHELDCESCGVTYRRSQVC